MWPGNACPLGNWVEDVAVLLGTTSDAVIASAHFTLPQQACPSCRDAELIARRPLRHSAQVTEEDAWNCQVFASHYQVVRHEAATTEARFSRRQE